MEAKLLQNPGRNAGYMNESEFTEATDQILAVPNSQLRKSLFKEAEAYVVNKENITEGVPTLRLARILCQKC